MIADEQLATQLQEGDESALEAIVRRYHGPIHAYIVRMGSDYHGANDIVQEIFLKVCRSISQYKHNLPFRPWIYTIASNTYKDHLKKAYVKHDVTGLENYQETAAAPETPEDTLLINWERNMVAAALGQLGQIHREVLVLRYYQELKLEEIAAVLQIPLGTVKSRLSTALHQLKKILVEEEVADVHTAKW